MNQKRSYLPAVDLALDLMKLLRSFWLTQAEIGEHYGVCVSAVSRLVGKMVENGYLLCETRPRKGDARMAKHYTVAPMWKGPIE